MLRVLRFTSEAKARHAALRQARGGALQQVNKALGLLQTNPAHPGLHTHEFSSLSTRDRKVFEAYAQNNTPGAYRILWHYGPDEHDDHKKRIPVITIISILNHPA